MVLLSKRQLICNFPFIKSCQQFHYSGNENCTKNALICFLNGVRSCSKYYIPVYMLQLALLGRDNFNWNKGRDIVLRYLRSIVYGGTFATTICVPLCILRKIFGIIDIRTAVITDLIIGAIIFCEGKRNRQLNAYMVSTMALEAMVYELEAHNLITMSPLRSTLKFMAINGLIMYFLARRELKSLNFWFYNIKPIKEKSFENIDENNIPKCTHKTNCKDFLKRGFLKYFLIGYGWNIIKLFLKNLATMMKRPRSMPSYLVRAENFKFGAVLGLYAGIYRFIMCNLLKIDSVRSAQRRAVHSAVAGVCAATTYIIKPNLQFGLTALVTLLQIFYERLKESTLSEEVWAKVPGGELCFLIMVSYLNVTFMINAPEMQRASYKFIYDTFTGNTVHRFRAIILREMKLIP